jgi:hypothetical protein
LRWLPFMFIVGCSGDAHTTSVEAPAPLPSSASSDVAAPRVVAGGVIPNTDVEDTPDNRAVLDVCERYRNAVEAQDVDAILAITSAHYRDHGITRDGLASFLHGSFKQATHVRYEARYLAIAYADRRAMVDYQYTSSFDLNGTVRHTVERNRLTLDREQGQWAIISGM